MPGPLPLLRRAARLLSPRLIRPGRPDLVAVAPLVEPLEGRRLLTLTIPPPPVDPTVTLFTPPVAVTGEKTHSVMATYMAAANVDVTTIDASDVVVTGPFPDQALDVIDVHLWFVPFTSPTMITATYTVAARGGSFDTFDTGHYTVSLAAGAVLDQSGAPFPAATTSFTAAATPLDTLPPAARFNGGLTTTGMPEVDVEYRDDAGIDITSVNLDDVVVTGPAGTLKVASVRPRLTSFGATVAYTIPGPGGSWDAADNGMYTVSVPAGAVRDTSGNPVAAVTEQAEVVIGPPPPGPDLVAELVPDPKQPTQARLGQAGVVRVKVTNQGTEAVNAPVPIRLVARGNEPQQVGNALVPVLKELAVTPVRPLRLKPGQSRIVPIRFHYPKEASSYAVVATVDPDDKLDESVELNNDSTLLTNVAVVADHAEVKPGGAGAPRGGFIPIGHRMTVPVTLRNDGNKAYRGPVNIDLFATNGSLSDGGSYVRLGSGTVQKRVRIRPDGTRIVLVSVLVDPALPPGEYTFRVNVNVPPAAAAGPSDFNNSVTGGEVYTAK